MDLVRKCVLTEICSATKEDVTKLHSPSIYDLLLSTHKSNNINLLESISSKYDAVYIHPVIFISIDILIDVFFFLTINLFSIEL